MNSLVSTSNFPKNIDELIYETYEHYNNNIQETKTHSQSLIYIIKKYHLWPTIKVKKFKNRDDIVLLHSNYKLNKDNEYKELYEQCRSIVLDFNDTKNNVVVTYANSIPIRVNYDTYNNTLYKNEDKCFEAYDGTIITIYNYKGEWHFGTSSCPDANSSKFSHPTKSHGNMFDEILLKLYKKTIEENSELGTYDELELSKKLKEMFVSNLDITMAYEFIIIHYENIHIIDYTLELGENYMELLHISTKNRETREEWDDISSSIPNLIHIGVLYPKQFELLQDARDYISLNPRSYGLIIKKQLEKSKQLYKISTDYVRHREETDPCHPNSWMNILVVYMKNKNEYTIKDYINDYNPELSLPLDNNNREIDPTYLIHTIISSIKDILYSYYILTTSYYPKYTRFKMNKEMDKQFPPIIQYHLAQLRNLQITTYKERIINSRNVYHYLCQCNDIKNIKTLIQFFASNPVNEMNSRTSMCFAIMNSLIS